MFFRKRPKKLSAATKRVHALLDELQLSKLKKEQQVVLAMEMHSIFDVKALKEYLALKRYSEAELIEGGFPDSAARRLLASAARISLLGRDPDNRAFVWSPYFNGGVIMLAQDPDNNHEDVYLQHGLTSSDVRRLQLDGGMWVDKGAPIQGFCHKDTANFSTIPKEQYESLGIVIKGKISEDWWRGNAGNAAKQGKRLEKLQARGEEAIAAAGSVHGDAAVLLDICRVNPHIATMKAGWPPTSSDLSQAQLDGVTVNSTGQVTELNLDRWQLTGESLCIVPMVR